MFSGLNAPVHVKFSQSLAPMLHNRKDYDLVADH